jgi:hypothetical protein
MFLNSENNRNLNQIFWGILFVFFEPESIEWLIEAQAFLRSDDSAPHPTPFRPLPAESCLSFSVFQCVAGKREERGERGEGVGEELNHTTARKPGPLSIIQNSLLRNKSRVWVGEGGGGGALGEGPF